MTPDRAERKLQGMRSICARVHRAVPINEAWHIRDILREIVRQGGTPIEMHNLAGTLSNLKDSGLVSEPEPKHFRSTVRIGEIKIEDEEESSSMPRAIANPVLKPEQAAEVIKPTPAKPAALDQLASLANELASFADTLRHGLARVAQIASELEEVALSIEHEREADQALLAKARRLTEALDGFRS